MSTVRDTSSASSMLPEHPPTQNWRFEFGDYAHTRCFLDEMAVLSKRLEYYPDMSFGRTYVNVSVDSVGQAALAEQLSDFISEMEALAAMQTSNTDITGER